jgi:hypothetical protein
MIKHYCDACGSEVEKSVTSNRLRGCPMVENTGVNFEIMSGTNGIINGGDLCVNCLIKAINICYGPPADKRMLPKQHLTAAA